MVKKHNSNQKSSSITVKTLLPVLAIVGLAFIIFFQFSLGLGRFQTIVIALVFIGFSAIEDRKLAFASMGFRRQFFKAKTLLLYAPLTGLFLCMLYLWVLMPLANFLGGTPVDLSAFNRLEGDTNTVLLALPFIWLTAAFAEEIVYRGYLVTRLQSLIGKERVGLIFSIVISSVIFGYAHSYQGVSGQLVTGMIGAILALIYHYKKYNLWFNVVIHGVVDSIALFIFYSGWHHSLL